MEIIKLCCKLPNLIYAFLSFWIIAIALSGCSDSETFNFENTFNIYKVYDDTVAHPDNPSISISAGNGRMFMTYGYASYGYVANGNLILRNPKSRVMAVDNNGNFLWRKNIPEAFANMAVAATDDGGCVVASQILVGINPEYSQNYIYLFCFDKDGNRIRVDSISLIPEVGTLSAFVGWMYSYRTPSGKIIFHGGCNYQNDITNGAKGFAFEYSPNAGVVWFRQYSFPYYPNMFEYVTVTGCVQTPDNGYLFEGNIIETDSSYNSYYKVILFKTNATGDTLWSKSYKHFQGIWTRNIINTLNGNYRFCFTDFPITNQSGKANLYIYEVNSKGDSISSVKVDNKEFNVGTQIIETDNGGCVVMVNQAFSNVINSSYNYFFRQTNTRKLTFDPFLKMTSDATFQTLSTDFLPVVCRTSDGSYAYFGITQAIGKNYYHPHLYIYK